MMTANAATSPEGKEAGGILAGANSFSSFSVNDLHKAKEFYGDTLGLELKKMPEGLELHLGGNSVFIYPKSNHTPASFTVLNFQVADIEKAVEQLKELGVNFEHYDLHDIKTDERGIARGPHGPIIAWFKDPAGNILSVFEKR